MSSIPCSRRAITAVLLVAAVVLAACTVDDRKVQLEDGELLSASYEIEPVGTVSLVDGSATAEVDGEDVQIQVRQPVTRGDVDGDELSDAALLVDLQSPDGNDEVWLVLVRNRFGEPEPLPGVLLGANVVVEEVTTEDGQLRIQMLDRSESAGLDTVDQRRTVAFSVVDDQTTVVSDERVPFSDLPPASETLSEESVELDSSQRATLRGRLEPDRQARYKVQVASGERLDASLVAPLGVYLTVSQGDTEIIGPVGAVAAQVAVPGGGELTVDVRNVREEAADFEMAVEVSRKPPPAPPVQPGDVYLTFDDGPHGTYTPQILDILKRHNAKATFFVLGENAQARPDLIDRILSEGHAIANHTWNHPDLVGKSDQQFEDQVGRTQALLGPRATYCLRPPYGSANDTTRRQAEEAGMRIVLWTADTNDWRRPGAAAIARSIVNGVHDGANILMHDGGGDRTQTVAGLEQALDQLSGDGWRFRPAC